MTSPREKSLWREIVEKQNKALGMVVAFGLSPNVVTGSMSVRIPSRGLNITHRPSGGGLTAFFLTVLDDVLQIVQAGVTYARLTLVLLWWLGFGP